MKTSLQVFYALRALRLALQAEYGVDYSYRVMAGGNMLAASNNIDGFIEPEVRV